MNVNIEKQLLEAVFETISNEVQVLEALLDSTGAIVDFEYLAGSKAAYGGDEDLRGRSLLSVYPWKKTTGLFDRFVNVVEKDETLDEVININERGQSKWYHIRARKFNHGLVVFREDVTIEKQAEEKIMQLNRALFSKNKELEALSSELKTFNSIAATDYSETLRQLYTSMEFVISNDAKNMTDAGKANIRRAQAAIQKMKLLTSDIIAFSSVQSEEQQMSPVDLNETLANVLNSLDQKITNENAVIESDRLPVVPGYAPLVSLLFFHLISNAIKFRKAEIDPVISVIHKVKKGTDIEHSAALKDVDYNMIAVIDNGIGFPPEEGEKIFTMFYRLQEKGKHKGSGIGLAICKKVMDLHGGFIASECTPECTTFKCYFPIQKGNSAI
jgi:signal transduction histidine kinase